MKKLLFIALLAVGMNAKAQITLEHTYDSAATCGWCPNYVVGAQLMIINFEASGQRYVRVSYCGEKISIYNLNHSLIKNIDFSFLPLSSLGVLGDIIYISEHLFNNDDKLEYMYVTDAEMNFPEGLIQIYNEDGLLLFEDSCLAWIKPNFIQQQMPIYNTSQGTKMILSTINGQAKVYSLPGTLSLDIQQANNNLIAAQSQSLVSNAYPNPTTTSTQIDYKLPDGINEGEIVFYDLAGNEVKRFKVDKTFSTLLVSTADIEAGTYLYQLQTTAQSSEGKKMVVIK